MVAPDVLINEPSQHISNIKQNASDFYIQPEINNNIYTNHFNCIKEFYRNSVIFITGGTGFLGKALIEKLLRSCSEVKTIYVLVRPKKGLSSNERYKEFIKQEVFDRIRTDDPTIFNKLVCLPGDITLPHLGLNEIDLEQVLENVNIVFHSAATVKFNEGLKDAAELNAFGTQSLLELCSKMTNLKSVVHVSTAYSNPDRTYVGEIVYTSTGPMDKSAFMTCVRILPKDVLEVVAREIQGVHPNTYTLTKSIAEQIVSDYARKIPICIIRPSIVTAAIQEPFPGWIDNIQGITGIMMEIGRGAISSILGDRNAVCDIIPVDVVVNSMIAGAWTTSFNSNGVVQVYNCTSGQIRPITWQELGDYTQKWARINPTKYLMLYPNFSYRKNEYTHTFYEIFFQFLPAYIFDFILKMKGAKPIMFKIAKKFKTACRTGKFFALNEWHFENANQRTLVQSVQGAKDGKEFNCDISQLNYDDYIHNYMLGIRKFVLRDGMESMEAARKKLSRLYWVRTTFQTIMLMICLNVVVKKWFL